MRGLIILCGILALCVFALGMLPASALPLSELSRVYPYLVRKARICLLTGIPTQANPIMDAELLAEIRRRLPDTFACGRCATILRAIYCCLLLQDLPVTARA